MQPECVRRKPAARPAPHLLVAERVCGHLVAFGKQLLQHRAVCGWGQQMGWQQYNGDNATMHQPHALMQPQLGHLLTSAQCPHGTPSALVPRASVKSVADAWQPPAALSLPPRIAFSASYVSAFTASSCCKQGRGGVKAQQRCVNTAAAMLPAEHFPNMPSEWQLSRQDRAQSSRRSLLTVNSTNCGVSARVRPPGGSMDGHTQSGAAPLPGHRHRYQVGREESSPSLGAAAIRGEAQTVAPVVFGGAVFEERLHGLAAAGGGWRRRGTARGLTCGAAQQQREAEQSERRGAHAVQAAPAGGGRRGWWRGVQNGAVATLENNPTAMPSCLQEREQAGARVVNTLPAQQAVVLRIHTPFVHTRAADRVKLYLYAYKPPNMHPGLAPVFPLHNPALASC